ncbi:agmatine deiminase family protein [Alteromonas oceanisediminis]|uniref:agmatine deiminase family protein n=1 Tax=Alteromonas oceanisediminis TaxID=2836180 RepID=UPI001BDA2FED|nr:agmatine deiminase family protein [Alteromonas oceanisediminis]MBT0586969.1 agmatine deiminase family protein [Alteromonas oceanisediminis]
MRLIPEWAAVDAIVLAWPNENTDWAPWLEEVKVTYSALISAINAAGASVILLHREGDNQDIKRRLEENANVLLVEAQFNDTWARDYAFLTCEMDGVRYPVEFEFNGWGNKFDARLDNQVNQRYLAPLCQQALVSIPIVCEGGALEIDAEGHLLTTQMCLSNPQRNGDFSLVAYQETLERHLGADKVSILKNGHLEGDDTDGHIDTLVRFTPQQGLVIQSCANRKEDDHCEGLGALVEECQRALPDHDIFELPLPFIVNGDGERLPASYANYLICNRAVICPIYQQPEDQQALEVLVAAYPDHAIVPVNCLPLVQQFGSLHCVTMQIPQHTLRSDIVALLQQGVTDYANQ